MIKISTFADNIYLNAYEYINNNLTKEYKLQSLIPISEDFKKIELLSSEENEGYFEGRISILNNNQIIIDKNIPTSDLYMLWYDLYQTTVMKTYEFSYLDVNLNIQTLQREDDAILISTVLEEKFASYILPYKKYKKAVHEGLIEFYNHLNHDYVRNDFDSPYYFKLTEIFSEIS
ncbi:hypothetical protein KFV05_00405 [Macrococcoides canis]|uniref:hypothetical protein n=1 Tax=Macrococcoides canis TaxID=1855823 RepID=UPI0020B8F5C2|nr:hypothetical protein [Macrococcus canis]UTH02497.1 hypothetical protein KFV05_00405 [Macrococcus canis]